MDEPCLCLTATDFLLKNGLTEKDIDKVLQQERTFIKEYGIPNFFEENTGCTLVEISLDRGVVLYDKNSHPIVVMNEKGKEITNSGYFTLTVDLFAENDFAVVLGAGYEDGEGCEYARYHQLLRSNHWDEVNVWLRKYLHHSLHYLAGIIYDKIWNKNVSTLNKLMPLYPHLVPIVEKAVVFTQETFDFNGEDDDSNEVLPNDTIILIKRELYGVFGARYI